MCGITGAIWQDPRLAIDQPTLERMTAVLAHRGPDDEGTYSSQFHVRPAYGLMPGVVLGHRRLSIIDVAGGHQPMSNEDGSIWVVFNGEIYNYRDLQRRLEGSGHKLRTRSDTETIVHLYEDQGLKFLDHLNGMFALAIWDARLGRLVLARDRLGKKPLVYRLESGRLIFASELKSILQVPGVLREVDPQALDQFLTYQYVPHPRTIFRGVSKLPPAHYAVYQNGQLTTNCYWRPRLDREVERPAEEYAEQLRETMTSAVRLRLESDVPVGAFLSGGVDSSLVVALMQQLSDQRVKTFSIGFGVAEYDETPYARQVARHLGTDHHEFRVEADAVKILPRLAWHFDEPFGDSSAIPTYYVAQMTRQHVKVALTGDGGDELFAGYPRYQAVALAAPLDRLPRGVLALLTLPLWEQLGRRHAQKSVVRRMARFSEALGQSPGRRYYDWISIFNESRRAALYSEQFVAQLPNSDPFDFLAAALARVGHRDAVTSVSLADLLTYLPCDLLTKVDIASMAHGLECRQPLLDFRLVELAAQMPIRMKFRRGRGKWILREAFKDLLPRAIFRRRKVGFGVPLDHWLRGELKPLVREVLLDSRSLNRGYFRPAAVRQLVEEHETRRFNHGYRIWSLLMLELWHCQWMDCAA